MSATFVSPAANPVGGSGLTISQAFAVPATSDCAVAGVTWDANSDIAISSITYGGSVMTAVAAGVNNATGAGHSFSYAQQFYVIAPPTGTNTLAVTFNGSTAEWFAGIRGFVGVTQALPIRPGSSITNTSTDVTSGTDNLLFDIVIPSDPQDITVSCFMPVGNNNIVSTTQTLDGAVVIGTFNSMALDHATTPGADPVTHQWSLSPVTPPGTGVVFNGCSLNGDPGLNVSELGLA